jgi:hypothetical protein
MNDSHEHDKHNHESMKYEEHGAQPDKDMQNIVQHLHRQMHMPVIQTTVDMKTCSASDFGFLCC